MVGVVAGVEEMVVQRPVEPIVDKLNMSYVKQRHDDSSLCFPHWHESDTRDGRIGHVEKQRSKDGLVIPVQNGKDNLLALHATYHLLDFR